MTRTSGQSLPNSESRSASPLTCRRRLTSVPACALAGTVCLLLGLSSTRGDDLHLGGLRLFNQGRDLRLFVQPPETNTVYELQTAPALDPGAVWTRAQLGHLGQTNFVVALPSNGPAFFRLRVPPLSGPAQLSLAEDTTVALAPIRVHLQNGTHASLNIQAMAGRLSGLPNNAGTEYNGSGSQSTLQRVLEQIRYVPPTNFYGKDRIRFELAFTNQAPRERLDLELVLTPVNDRPIALSDAFACAENSTLFIPGPGVLGNDIEVEGEPLSARLLTGPVHGALAFDFNGGFVYLPDSDFTGADQFSYLASDGANESDPAWVELNITPASGTPAARLKAPLPGAQFTEGTSLPLEIEASTQIVWQRADYFSGSNVIATASIPPFTATWLNAPKGTHTLRAQLWDTAGRSFRTDSVVVQVEPDCDRDGLSDAMEIAQGQDPCAELSQQMPWLSALDGDIQTGAPGSTLPYPLRARLLTRSGATLTNHWVHFVTEDGGARLAPAPTGPWQFTNAALTDSSGVASAWVLLPLNRGVSLLRASATNGGAQAQVSFIVTAYENTPAWQFENTPVAVAAGAEHTLALLADGTVLRWGRNQEGQLGVEPALLPRQPQPELWPGLSNVVAIAAGGYHSLLLTANGTLSIAGEYLEHEPTFVPPGLTDVIAIAAGQDHSLALLANGTVRAWGDSFSNHQPPPGLSEVTGITAGLGFSVALKADQTVVAWGTSRYHPNFGQTNVPFALENVRAISAGGYHTLALRSDGTVVAWGADGYGQSTVPAGLNHVVAIAAGFTHSLALRSDGTVVAWGDNQFGQLGQLETLTDVIAVSAGGGSAPSHSLALRADGSLWAWGANAQGQLGDGGSSSGPLPRRVSLAPGGFISEEIAFELHTPLQ